MLNIDVYLLTMVLMCLTDVTRLTIAVYKS